MGSWRIARDGGGAGTLAGNSQRTLAEWLFDRISLGSDCLEISPARVGMAPYVLDWRAACITCAVHSHESAGIRSMEATPGCEHGPGSAHRCRRVETLCLSRRSHDLHDVPLARNAGSLSGLSERSA